MRCGKALRRSRAEATLRFGPKGPNLSVIPVDRFGDAAWISFGGIDVILNSTRAQSFDPSLFSVMGIDPRSRKILLIKSTNHFYDSFSKIASEIVYCAAGKPYPNRPAETDYRKARRDIWPMVENPWG